VNSLQIGACCPLGLCHGADTQVGTDVLNGLNIFRCHLQEGYVCLQLTC